MEFRNYLFNIFTYAAIYKSRYHILMIPACKYILYLIRYTMHMKNKPYPYIQPGNNTYHIPSLTLSILFSYHCLLSIPTFRIGLICYILYSRLYMHCIPLSIVFIINSVTISNLHYFFCIFR